MATGLLHQRPIDDANRCQSNWSAPGDLLETETNLERLPIGKSLKNSTSASRSKQSKKNSTTSDKKNRSELLEHFDILSEGSSDDSTIIDCLEATFDSGRVNETFSVNEKKRIGHILKNKLPIFFVFILRYCFDFSSAKVLWYLVFRSAIQFIFDNYKDFPTNDGNEILLTVITKIQSECDAIEVLDKQINHWKESKKYGVDINNYFRKDFVVPEGIPATHTWWY